MTETECIGGLGKLWGGHQFHQQHRVYTIGRLALCLPSQIPGGSYLYLEIKKMKLNMIGQMDGSFVSKNRVYDPNGLSPTLQTPVVGGHIPNILETDEIEKVFAFDEQNNIVREDIVGTITTDGSSPKHNNRVLLIKEATEKGYTECFVGGWQTCHIRIPKQEGEG